MPSTTKVHEIMTTDVVAFTPDDPISGAMAKMVDRGVSAAPVIDEARKVVGMLSDSDLIVQEARLHGPTVIELLGAVIELPGSKHRFEEELRRVTGLTVGDVMTTGAVTIGPDDTVEDAATRMHDSDVSRLPVVDADDRLVGLVARGDILRLIVRGAGG